MDHRQVFICDDRKCILIRNLDGLDSTRERCNQVPYDQQLVRTHNTKKNYFLQ